MDLKKINKTVIVTIIIGLLIVRFAGDALLFIIDKSDTNVAILWKTLTTLILIIPVYILIFRGLNSKISGYSEEAEKIFFLQLNRISLLIFILFSFYLFLHFIKLKTQISNNLFALLSSEIYALYSIILSVYILFFIWLWLLNKRHRRTIFQLVILRNGLFYFVIVEVLITLFPSMNKPVVSIVSKLMAIFIAIVMLSTSRNNQWLALLPKPEKIKLLWLSLFVVLVNSYITYSIYLGNTIINVSLLGFSPGAISFVAFVLGISVIYFFRILISVLASIPTSYIIERKMRELSSLRELNKVVSDSIEMNLLLETVVRLALKSTKGLAGWIELYDKDGTTNISASQNLDEEKINILDKSSELEKIFKSLEKPLVIDSIYEDKILSKLNWSVIPTARALIAVPLHSSGDKIGVLVVLCTDEYGFDDDDVKILTAFSDNVSIAIENSRLVKDSIEKERYKQELMLARNITEKLLPQKLPSLKNYHVKAFSLPAEEVGGDYYDIVNLKNGKPCIIIADVSGKGMSAAFYMAQLKGVVMSLARESECGKELLKRINTTLYKAIDRQMYITMSAFVIDNEEGKATFARAGHMPGLFKNNGDVTEIIPRGIGVGLAPQDTFNEHIEELELQFKENDVFLLFTDGLNELKNQKQNDLGIESLVDLLKQSGNDNPIAIESKLKNLITDFSQDESQIDDITVVIVKYAKMLK
ncbi:MAG: SpoIIE family protein phosphatase [Ignavibacteriae bacterium]|nr:SpoIIE family protein phosphatase [Ignavibacteriota bacterium]